MQVNSHHILMFLLYYLTYTKINNGELMNYGKENFNY